MKIGKAAFCGVLLSLLFYYTVKTLRSSDTGGQVTVYAALAFCYWTWAFNEISHRMLAELRLMREILDAASGNLKPKV